MSAVTFQAWGADFQITATILGDDDVRYSCTKDGEPRFTDLTLSEARRQVECLVAAAGYRTSTALLADAHNRAKAHPPTTI